MLKTIKKGFVVAFDSRNNENTVDKHEISKEKTRSYVKCQRNLVDFRVQ